MILNAVSLLMSGSSPDIPELEITLDTKKEIWNKLFQK